MKKKFFASITHVPGVRGRVDMYSCHDWPWFHEYFFIDRDYTKEELLEDFAAFKERCSTNANIRKKSLQGPLES